MNNFFDKDKDKEQVISVVENEIDRLPVSLYWDLDREEELLIKSRLDFEMKKSLRGSSFQAWLPTGKQVRKPIEKESYNVNIKGPTYILCKAVEFNYNHRLEADENGIDKEVTDSYRIFTQDEPFGRNNFYGDSSAKYGEIISMETGKKNDFIDLIDIFSKSFLKSKRAQAIEALCYILSLNDEALFSKPTIPQTWKIWPDLFGSINNSRTSTINKNTEILSTNTSESHYLINDKGSLQLNYQSITIENSYINLPLCLIERKKVNSLEQTFLFNSNHRIFFNSNMLKNKPNANVFIVDNLSIQKLAEKSAIKNKAKHIWTSWYYGPLLQPPSNIDLLRDRVVSYIITGDLSQRKIKYEVASNAIKEIIKAPNITLYIVDYMSDNIKILSFDDFNNTLKELGIIAPEIRKRRDKIKFNKKNPSDLTKPKPVKYLLQPAISESSISLLYSEEGTGKTWLSLSMAYATAFGTSLFKEKWEAKKAVKTLYLDAEMGTDALSRRNQILFNSITSKLSKEDLEARNDNLIFHSLNEETVVLQRK